MTPFQYRLFNSLYLDNQNTILSFEYPSDIHGSFKICYQWETRRGYKFPPRVIEMDKDGRIIRSEEIGKD